MNSEVHSKPKTAFQLERFILFSDAVFAIAITLLVLEIKVPEITTGEITEHKLLAGLAHMVPKFIGFIVSFFLIGLYWTVHHRMFGYVVNYTQRLLWLNLLFLLGIVLMPFSTAFYSEYVYLYLKSPLIIYVCNISFIGCMNFALYSYISNPKHDLTEGLSRPLARYFILRSLMVPFIFITVALVYIFISPKYAIWIPPVTPLLMKIIFKRHKRKLNL